LRFRTKKPTSGPEMRLEMHRHGDPSSEVLYRICDELVYAYEACSLAERDKYRLKLVLLGPPDHGKLNKVTNNLNLAKKEQTDTGPFNLFSSKVTMVTITGRHVAASRGHSTLQKAWENLKDASLYLTYRDPAQCPIRAPCEYSVVFAADAAKDKKKTVPLSMKELRSSIRLNTEKDLQKFFAHVLWVRKKGAPLPVAFVARAAEQPFQRGRVDG